MGPLEGLKVVEFAGLGPAPFAAMMLSDMGATVVRITRVNASGPHSGHDTFLDRGRTDLALDLSSPEGLERARAEIRAADILIEGFRPGVMERLGLGPDAALLANPRLVYGRMTGYGRNGPLAQKAGHDINFLALSGILDLLGPKDQPPLPPLNLIADFGGGGMYLAFGLVCATFEAARSGKGQVVDAAMVHGVTHLASFVHAQMARGRWEAGRENNLLDGGAPFYRTYETKGGKYVAIGPVEPKFFANLLRVLAIEDDYGAVQFDRSAWPQMHARFAQVFKTRTRAEWDQAFADVDACYTPVLSMSEALTHAQMQGTTRMEKGVVQPSAAPIFSRTPPRLAPQ